MSESAKFFLPAPAASTDAQRGALQARRYIDPRTRDYVVEGGRLKQDDGFTSKVVLALATRLGSCLAYPKFGSRLHEVRRADEQGRRLAEKFALLALSHLKNEIADLQVVAALVPARPGAIDIVVSGRRGGTTLQAAYSAVLR